MLQADNISIHFGDEHVLDRFSCHVERGAFVCVVGASGCGKTSLLKCFIGITPLTEGSVRVGSDMLSEHSCAAIRKRVAYLPQDLAMPYDTVDDAVRQLLKIGGLKHTQQTMLTLRDNMMRLGLDEELLGKRVAEISGGQRQRLMLAALALLDRELWLLDEPTSALDKVARDYVMDFLAEQQRKGKTIVAVSHDAAVAAQCTAIIKLK